MSHFNMKRRHISDEEIERVLSGSPEASDENADLKWFRDQMSEISTSSRNVEHMATALASVARSSAPRLQPRRAIRRMTALAASVGLLLAMSGIAMAADNAAPGDLLYGIDKAFESIGINDGGIDERIDEFDTLVARGDSDEAYQFLDEYIDSASEDEANRAQSQIVAEDRRSEIADGNVSDHQQFIEDNQKQGIGADGKKFGQGVADAVGKSDQDLPNQAKETEPPDHANRNQHADQDSEPSEDKVAPEHAGRSDSNGKGDPDGSNPNNISKPPDSQGNSGNGGGSASGGKGIGGS